MAVVLPARIASRTCVHVMSSISREIFGAPRAGSKDSTKASEARISFIGVRFLLTKRYFSSRDEASLAGRQCAGPVFEADRSPQAQSLLKVRAAPAALLSSFLCSRIWSSQSREFFRSTRRCAPIGIVFVGARTRVTDAAARQRKMRCFIREEADSANRPGC